MKTILLSFEPYWFEKMSTGQMPYEYRKHLPEDGATVYFYVSRPVKAITGIAHFGKREALTDWLQKYADRGPEVVARIKDYLQDCTYVCPVLDFQPTSQISLETLKKDIPNFIVPRMYFFLDNTPLLAYLQQNLKPTELPIKFTHPNPIPSEEICNL